MTPSAKTRFKRVSASLVAFAAPFVLRRGLTQNPDLFRRLERRGLHLTDALDYERPIPNLAELAAHYPARSECTGINLNPERQLELLTQTFPRFVSEFQALPERSPDIARYSRLNDAFPPLDGLAYWSLIRDTQPSRVLEIGSGFSTLLARQALEANGHGCLTVVDPYPRPFILLADFGANHLRVPVEHVDRSLFQTLHSGDILFVDTSHVVRTGGDVTFLFLEIFPILPPGVLVHVHDIYLPFDYPADLVIGQRRFWTEQYLLQAYMCWNPRVDVEFGSYYCSHQYPAEIQHLLPVGPRNGASLWFKTVSG